MATKAKPNPANPKLFDEGMKVRKAVLGEDYVDNSIASADDLMMAFQDVTTEYCWDYVLRRPGLPKKTRAMLNLAMLSALNRGPELKLHVNGALNNGVTKDEIKEMFCRSPFYSASPPALTLSRPRATSSRIGASEPWSRSGRPASERQGPVRRQASPHSACAPKRIGVTTRSSCGAAFRS